MHEKGIWENYCVRAIEMHHRIDPFNQPVALIAGKVFLSLTTTTVSSWKRPSLSPTGVKSIHRCSIVS